MTTKYPLFKVAVNSNLAVKNIEDVFASGFINEGAQVLEFENALRKDLEVDNLVVTNSCTSALHIAYRVSGVTKGAEVISSPMTCIATNTPIANLGGKIVWCDIDPQTGNIDHTQIESLISESTKAIVYVDWAGNPAELEAIWKIGQKYNIKVIQDAAHAYGAKWNGKSIANYADFTCYSFQAIKHLNTGDGGALVCQNPLDLELARKLKWFGYDRDKLKDKNGEWRGQRWDSDITAEEIGYKFNMNNISAAIGISNIVQTGQNLEIHRRNAQIYTEKFENSGQIVPLKQNNKGVSSYWVFTVILKFEDEILRDKIIWQLNNEGIGAGLVHIPNDRYSAFKESSRNLPGLREFEKRQFSLPCGWWLEPHEIKEIADKTLSIVRQVSENRKLID